MRFGLSVSPLLLVPFVCSLLVACSSHDASERSASASEALPTASGIATSLPYMIHGSPAGSLMSGDYPLYDPVAPFVNSAGTAMAASDMRFVDFYKNTFTFGMQKGLDYFHLWQGAPKQSPVCQGELVNDQNVPVSSDQLSHVVVGDFDGSGQLQVFGLHTDVSWYYVWKIGAQIGAQHQPCASTFRYAPVASGPLYDDRAPITGSAIKSLIPTDWNNDDLQEVIGFPDHGSRGIAWQAHRGAPAMSYWRSFSLGSLDLASMLSITDNREAAGGPTSPTKNAPGGTELLFHTTWGLSVLGTDGTLRSVMSCAGSPQLCRGTTLLLSVDQSFRNGPINAFRQGNGAATALIGEIKKVRDALASAGTDVVALVNPSHSDKTSLERFLDALQTAGVPFMFDAISSDSQTAYVHDYSGYVRVHEPVEGVSLSIAEADTTSQESLEHYIAKYPSSLRGFRIMEQLGVDRARMECRYWFKHGITSHFADPACTSYVENGDAHKEPFIASLYSPAFSPVDAVGDPVGWAAAARAGADITWARNVTSLLDLAARSSLAVVWSEPLAFDPYQYYHAGIYPDALNTALETERLAYIDFRASLAARYPNTIVALYDNNEGTKVTGAPGFSTAQETPRSFRHDTWFLDPSGVPHARAWGLSNQSWLADQHPFWNDELLPPQELAGWTIDALNLGAKWIELEPLWYFFHWQRASDDADLATNPAQSPCIGKATPNLIAQLAAFGVTGVSACAPQPSP